MPEDREHARKEAGALPVDLGELVAQIPDKGLRRS